MSTDRPTGNTGGGRGDPQGSSSQHGAGCGRTVATAAALLAGVGLLLGWAARRVAAR